MEAMVQSEGVGSEQHDGRGRQFGQVPDCGGVARDRHTLGSFLPSVPRGLSEMIMHRLVRRPR